MNITTGKRIAVTIPGYEGIAGFVEDESCASLSFPASRTLVAAGEEISADGRRWTVTKVGSSQFIRGFKVLSLVSAEEA